MATVVEGILGGFRGKIGTVVGVSNGGTYYMRSLPRKRKKAGNKELINQARFKAVIDHLEPIKPLVKAGFKGHYTKTGGHRAAFSYTRKHSIGGEGKEVYIVPELFKFSGGDLAGAAEPLVTVNNDQLEFTWNPMSGTEGGNSDQVMLLVYDPVNSWTLTRIYDGAFRSTGSDTMLIPARMKGREADIYIGFVAADRSAQSDSQYLGRFVL
jgi:hypothetical protein